MSRIVICRLDQIAQAAVQNGAREMVTLLSPGQTFHRPAVIAAERHLQLGVNDIDQYSDGLTAPEEGHVASLIAFARSWDRSAPLLVHCWLGISRSPAAALVAALAIAPDQDDHQLAGRLRAASPFVTPNRRIVEIGDRMLGRGGKLARAVERIGRGADASQGDIVSLSVEPPAPTGKIGARHG